MSKALPSEHYCLEHQGNTSHYAKENCVVCRLRQQATDDASTINALRETIERLTKEQRDDVDTINQLRLKKDAATARAERLETELRKLTYCPCCGVPMNGTHRLGCTTAAALKEPK